MAEKNCSYLIDSVKLGIRERRRPKQIIVSRLEREIQLYAKLVYETWQKDLRDYDYNDKYSSMFSLQEIEQSKKDNDELLATLKKGYECSLELKGTATKSREKAVLDMQSCYDEQIYKYLMDSMFDLFGSIDLAVLGASGMGLIENYSPNPIQRDEDCRVGWEGYFWLVCMYISVNKEWFMDEYLAVSILTDICLLLDYEVDFSFPSDFDVYCFSVNDTVMYFDRTNWYA